MADRITISGAAAGTAGAAYRKILGPFTKAAGDYVLNDTNFAGLGAYLPCNAIVSLTPAGGVTGTILVSTDNGTTWKTLLTSAVAGQAGMFLYLDTANTLRVTVAAGNCDVLIFVQ